MGDENPHSKPTDNGSKGAMKYQWQWLHDQYGWTTYTDEQSKAIEAIGSNGHITINDEKYNIVKSKMDPNTPIDAYTRYGYQLNTKTNQQRSIRRIPPHAVSSN